MVTKVSGVNTLSTEVNGPVNWYLGAGRPDALHGLTILPAQLDQDHLGTSILDPRPQYGPPTPSLGDILEMNLAEVGRPLRTV
jgi:hypothetical protein